MILKILSFVSFGFVVGAIVHFHLEAFMVSKSYRKVISINFVLCLFSIFSIVFEKKMLFVISGLYVLVIIILIIIFWKKE